MTTPADLSTLAGDADLAPEVLAARLRLANARLARRVRQEALSAGDDLTASRLAALATIERLGPITLGDLAGVEQVQPPSMTRIVGHLETAGLAVREVDAPRSADHPRAHHRLRPADARTQSHPQERVPRQAGGASHSETRAALAGSLPVLEALLDD